MILLLLAGCTLGAIATKKASHPSPSGTVAVSGLDAPVRITRDEHGVPHIRAETEHDLWFAVGFVHAQDRLFQMDLLRRLGSGRMAEWIGIDAAPFDAFMQSMELDARYAKGTELTSPQVIAVGDAYAAGVNAGAGSLPKLPVEYRVLDVEFETWERADAMASTLINSWALAENAPKELVTMLLGDKLSREQANALWTWDPETPEIDAYWEQLRAHDFGKLSPEFIGVVELLWGVQNPTQSNNWVVSGAHTADGSAMLANDPHMLQMVPSIWYVWEGSGGGVHVAGGGLTGTPFIATGHNERVSWGVTNVEQDVVDLAILERVGDTGYILAGEQKTLRPVHVSVPVKGSEPYTSTVYWTEVGPVINLDAEVLVALRWTFNELPDQTADMWYGIQTAGSVSEAMSAARRPSVLGQNLVVADVDGNIGWQAFGGAPQRKAHTGRVPYPASDPEHGWDGYVPMPSSLNPSSGVIATANSRPDTPRAWDISTAYLPPWRLDRIHELLAESTEHTADSFLEIQKDEQDQHAVTRIGEILSEAHRSSECGSALLDWDGASGPESSGAAVWAVFQHELIKEILTDELGEAGVRLYVAAAISGRSVLDAGWRSFTDSPDDAVTSALNATCERLGPGPWVWGEHHRLDIEHLFTGATGGLQGWSMERAPWGGSHQTVNQAGYSWYLDDLDATWIASIRVITPMSDVGNARFIYPGGQSGMPGHDHYADLFPTYIDGGTLPLWFHDADVDGHAAHTLSLEP